MIIDEEDYLAHYGTPRRSGRYPWGSGKDPHQSGRDFLGMEEKLRKEGMSEVDRARALGFDSVTQLRAQKSILKNAERQARIDQARKLKDAGMSDTAISREMKLPGSTVRDLLAPGAKDRVDVLQATASSLKDKVGPDSYIQIGTGIERHMGISADKLNTAVQVLKEEGYTVHKIKVPQLGTTHKTEIKVLCPPGTTQKEVFLNQDRIKLPETYSNDGGRSYTKIQPPLNISSKRVAIKYGDEGGSQADGVIYVRPGVEDVSLGKARYAQVRIAVDGTHYIKGMAMYSDDLPPGVDLMFNTNKTRADVGHNKLAALKKMERDKDGNIDQKNPFGSQISRQIGVDEAKGLTKPTSVMNIVNEEGNWLKWSNTLSSQMLSKQSPKLAKEQLGLAHKSKQEEFDEIMALTNPAVKRKLLMSFADDVDSAAVHLKAKAMPGQGTHVILPLTKIKETEIYAPNYDNGDRVVLIRHPHGGVFEIPELTVNNRNPQGKSLLKDAKDAVGIHPKVAEKLSGADFDGDHVLVIPNKSGKIKTAPSLERLKNFDPKREYPKYEGMVVMDARTKQREMGDISNLITDMTIKRASTDEIAKAVRHSMVVIDAEKHELNWKKSAVDNGIADFKEKYQGRKNAGASTLISRATSQKRIPDRVERPASDGGPIDKLTGKKMYVNTGRTYKDRKTGKVKPKTIIVDKLADTDNAFDLISDGKGTVMERVYAEHSNKLKAMANKARLEAVHIKHTPYSPSARTAYAKEVAKLNADLNLAMKNRPLERQAQVVGNLILSAKRRANPGMDAAELKKVKAQALNEARTRVGAKRHVIDISPDQWKAIQAGAISTQKLYDILERADLEQVKKYATPKPKRLMTASKVNRAKSMLTAGHTQAEVARALGVSLTTLKESLGTS